jgi:hypothetical protein
MGRYAQQIPAADLLKYRRRPKGRCTGVSQARPSRTMQPGRQPAARLSAPSGAEPAAGWPAAVGPHVGVACGTQGPDARGRGG